MATDTQELSSLAADRLADWLAERLRQEHCSLEARHQELCAAIRAEFMTVVASEAVRLSEGAGHQESEGLTPSAVIPTDIEVSCEGSLAPKCVAIEVTADDAAESSWAAARGSSNSSLPVCEQNNGKFTDDLLASRKNSMRKGTSYMFFGTMSVTQLQGFSHRKGKNIVEMVVRSSHFEFIFAVLIFANAFAMAVEAQRRGVGLGRTLHAEWGPEGVGEAWPGVKSYLEIAEICFGIAFTVELALKIIALRCRFIASAWNLLDSLVVAFWVVEKASGGGSFPVNPMALRICRLARVVRLLRLVRSFAMFDTLMLMLASIKASLSVLLWSVVLLGSIMMFCAMCLNSLLITFMQDEAVDLGVRQDVYAYFGSFSSSTVTMFEVTMGNWVPACRLLSDHVSEWYVLFFVFFKLTAGFAVLKVIAGVFLHETFKCAANDDELMIQTRERSKQNFHAKIARLFDEADTSGNGLLCRDEFVTCLRNSRVAAWMQAMDLNVQDPDAVFSFIAGLGFAPEKLTGNETISLEELVRGLGRLRGSAQQLDLKKLLVEQHEVCDALQRLRAELAQSRASAS